MADALSVIPPAVLRNLSDKLYEKRKNAALEIEGIVKQLAAAGEHDKITAVINLLANEFTYSAQVNHRKGGVALTGEAAQHLEICLEMLYFANYFGDADSSIVRETWARLIDQALSRGGIAEACAVLKRVGSHVYPGDGAVLPLDTLCLHLEKAALERLVSGVESVGDDDVARALLAACKGAIEPVLNTYDQLLSTGAILPSPNLRLRLLRSVLVILREWAMSVFAQRMNTSTTGASLILGGTFSLEQTTIFNEGVRDKITSAANRYMTEVRRLALSQNQTEAVYRGFRELEESLLSPLSFERF